jgi:hypothetical protein
MLKTMEPREKPIITTGTRMVVRRPDGLGTAQVGTSIPNLVSSQVPEMKSDSPPSDQIIRPHSTIQRAHSTVIPRSRPSKSSKESESRNLTSVMQKLISAQKMENILRNGSREPPTLNELAATDPLVAGVVADLKKDKKQKQRVGVNPVLGNAGVMWESNKKPAESHLVQKRKSVTEDLISPKKSKLVELAETAVSIQNEKFLEKRKDLDSYTGCLPKHMLHLLPATPKSLASTLPETQVTAPTVLQQPDLATILQQYSTLQAATGLATNENAKNLLGLDRTGLEQSTALLQFHILQQLQKTQQNFVENQNEPIVVNPSWNVSAPIKTNKNGPGQNGISVSSMGQGPTDRTSNGGQASREPPTTSSSSDSPYKITPRIEKSNSKVKCLKTALIPSITKAELDSNPKITNYQGLKMATNIVKPKNGGSITPKKSKVQANTCILPRLSSYSVTDNQTQLNIIGENERLLRDFLQKNPKTNLTATITLTNGETGETVAINGTCVNNSQTQFKNIIDIVPNTAKMQSVNVKSPISYSLNSVPRTTSRDHVITPTQTVPMFTITSSSNLIPGINQSGSSSKINGSIVPGNPSLTLNSVLSLPRPTNLSRPETPSSSSGEPKTPSETKKPINMNFPVLETNLALNRVVTNDRDILSPASSPEIIVDELTPETTEKIVSSSTAAAVLKAATSPTSVSASTPNRPTTGRGPKKNFLARQAALDAKLNVLRIRAEAEKKSSIRNVQ